MFDSLILKIKHSIQHWSSNFLTYAGRVQLLNSVIFGMETFWCSCNLLPQEVLHKINKLCKDFFWGISFEGNRMVFKKWRDICFPWDAGGFNIKDLSTWNDALQCRWLYLLAHTAVGSWASWHQAYILQHQTIWNIQTHDIFSSSLKGILIVRDRLVSLTAQKKLATVDNIQHRGFYMMNRCSLCEAALEDHPHLFFNCSFSKDIWQQLMYWMGVNRHGLCLLSELDHAGIGGKQNWRMAWFSTTLAAAVYQIWNERNSRLFRGRKATVLDIVRKIKFLVSTRLLMWNHHKCYPLIVASL
ncbi:uncharacterized protein LOC141649126 [Silene latifolia]|uniref:uncharacterized protein LOC141649126 n=1 Tax=Silene latifolia TaxID=37657 RepID=UPI003D789636